ncbi:hypothetical protein FACS189459_4660 [Bacilli bacterium]|nr:hypothetical protein FACS189459_4660 [Bacilli bacterium]GHU53454.1 hypothetical protein FACS189496_4810 [Bacilli bacterium]
MCASTLISTVVNGICTLSSQAHANDSTSSGSSSNSSKYVTNKSTGYLRISPYPNRSSFMMDI